MIVRHIFEISDDSRMRITTKSVHDKNNDFALRYVRTYPGVNSRAELVTLAQGLRPGSGIKSISYIDMIDVKASICIFNFRIVVLKI